MRINKFLASAGLGARRKCEELVLAGRVRINGQVVRDLGTRVAETDTISVDNKPVSVDTKNFVYIMLNKPAGYITSAADERGRKTVFDLVPSDLRLHTVGRLDYETEGLLLLTNDGDFTRRVTNPRSGVSKTYIATLDKPITSEHLKQLEKGIDLDGEKTHPATAQRQRDVASNIVRLVITQGRNRQVRRMFAALGYQVTHLRRTSIGNLALGELKIGAHKRLHSSEIDDIIKG